MADETLSLEPDAPIGVIADTHGLLRAEALALLADCQRLIHLGDVGDPAILESLGALAPLHAIRGNIDREGPCAALPARLWLTLGRYRLQLIHIAAEADTETPCDVILHGHSHKPLNRWQGEGDARRLWFNPGAAGKRRFRLPITLGKLWLDVRGPRGAILHLPLDA
ncbi:metallophosphoesterase family protein [Salinicola avicenniae]|uniref:metallophosphoesterase family protein n=1 Tax=Salinicola avicenniae TaxID=2916836 RepID=UPI0020732E1C|nr:MULTISPECIES: metallophosphoesterase family protein [unclassified Salinicola]